MKLIFSAHWDLSKGSLDTESASVSVQLQGLGACTKRVWILITKYIVKTIK